MSSLERRFAHLPRAINSSSVLSRFRVFARALMTWTLPGTYPSLGMIRSSDGDHFQGPEPAPRLGMSGIPSKGHLAGIWMSSTVRRKGIPCLRALYRASRRRFEIARCRVRATQDLHRCLPARLCAAGQVQGGIWVCLSGGRARRAAQSRVGRRLPAAYRGAQGYAYPIPSPTTLRISKRTSNARSRSVPGW